jgi:hypothetical protein
LFSCVLNWRARNVAKGAKNAAIPCLWLQQRPAALAFIEELAGVGRHCLSRLESAGRASDNRDKLHHRPRSSLSNKGSMYPQLAAATTVIEAHSRSASVAGERWCDAQLAPGAQAIGPFNHRAPQPATIATALTSRNGVRHSAIVSSPPRTPAPAPSAASPSGMTQHEDAVTAPNPATSPKAANHFGEDGRLAGVETAEVDSCAVSLMAMARSCLMVGVSCTP